MCCIALAGLFFILIAPAHADTTGRATVIDGDTLEIRGERIRLDAIDAPEGGQTCEADGQPWRCGQQAALALADKIGAGNVTCTDRGQDRYDRTLGICYLGDLDLNGWLVAEGWALASRKRPVSATTIGRERFGPGRRPRSMGGAGRSW